MAIEKIKILGAEYLSYVKFIATRVPTFLGYIISVLVSVFTYMAYRVTVYRTGTTTTEQKSDTETE